MGEMKEEFEAVKKQGLVKTFLNFDKMITPTIIKIIFYITLGVSVLISLGLIVSGIGAYYGGGLQVFAGILVLVLSPLIARVNAELLIVIFKIHESLIEIRNQ